MPEKSPHRLATYYNSQAANPLYHFISGARFFLTGWSLLFRNPPLLWLSLIPIVLTVVILGLVVFGSVWVVGQFFADGTPLYGPGLRLLAQAMTVLLVLFVGFLLYLPLARVLLAPFAEQLSRRTHIIVYGSELPAPGLNILRSMWEGAKLVSFQLLLGTLALLLGLVLPVIGPVLGVMLGSLFCSLDFLDVPLSTRGLPLGKKLAVWWRHKSLALGFGTAGYVLLLIPLVNLFTLPVGVLGATVIAGKLAREDEI